MIEVYRIEHKETGTGPFQTDHSFTQELAKKITLSEHFPSPFEDGLGLSDIPWYFVFGCPSIETMKKWILLGETEEENHKIISELSKLGFIMSYYLVEDDLHRPSVSGMQLAFGKSFDDEECQFEHFPLSILI